MDLSQIPEGIPKLYETEKTPPEEKLIYFHFYLGDSHWYAAEFDGKDTFFGYAILNGDMQNAEWGYFSLQELKSVKDGPIKVEIDFSWEMKSFAAAVPTTNIVNNYSK